MPARPLVYFICGGNACRSQMAEGFARQLGGGRWDAASGGLDASAVDPRAVAVMSEVGVDISTHQSKTIDPELLARADVVVTLCGEADEACPALSATTRRLHWPLADPARVSGGREDQLSVFRLVRDQIRPRVQALVSAQP